MNPRNIQEYVVQNIFLEMKYRDEEIEKLKLENANLRNLLPPLYKCDFCHLYRKDLDTCEFCELSGCLKCDRIRTYDSWNLSGCESCNDCVQKWCTFCRNIDCSCEK